MTEQDNLKLPILYEKYKAFAEAGMRFLKERAKKGVKMYVRNKSKVTFGEGNQITVNYESDPSYSIFISENEQDIKKLPEYIKCEDEVKEHPNYRNAFGMLPFTFLEEIVDKTKSLDFSEPVFNEVYSDFENFLLTMETSYKLHASLADFSMDAEIIELEPGLIIKKMTAEELSETIDCMSPFSFRFDTLHYRYRIEVNYKIKEELEASGKNPHEIAISTLKNVITALRMFKCGDVYDAPYYYMPVSWAFFIRGIASSSIANAPARTHIKPELKLEKSEIEDFKKFWLFYKEFLPKRDNFLFLNTAISRLDFAYDNSRVEDRLIDYMIAFEALFLKGNEDQELNYRLALRTAVLLGESKESKEEVFKNMKTAYKLRSLVVHGKNFDKLKKELEEKHKNVNEFILKIEEYLRKAIKQFLELIKTYSDQDAIIDYLDSIILH